MIKRLRLFSVMSIMALCVVSMGTFSPSALALNVEQPSYEAFKDNIIFNLLKAPVAHDAIMQRTEDRTHLRKSEAQRFKYNLSHTNIAITHFVKGGGVSYTHGGKAVATS